ncbi:hypothetical protein DY000_02023475 [Brassica cretica]|uniref:Uncharacterized protein n=1 Tax=Brassica cretica TaxID=69181 RepID=A0ABQ7EK68_BRACR|nr:hypothetical protein DY000_02023475 [Brassica cretica]
MLLHRSSEVALFLGCQERPTRWETMGVDMLLLDFQAIMMPATVNVNRLATHRPNTSPDLTYAGYMSLCLFYYCESDLSFAVVTLGLDLLLIGPSLLSGKLNKAANCERGKRKRSKAPMERCLVHASAYLQTDITTKEIIHCQMVGALKELEKLWLVREDGYAPAVGMKFESCDDDYNCYNCCAKHFGFLVRVKSSWF